MSAPVGPEPARIADYVAPSGGECPVCDEESPVLVDWPVDGRMFLVCPSCRVDLQDFEDDVTAARLIELRWRTDG